MKNILISFASEMVRTSKSHDSLLTFQSSILRLNEHLPRYANKIVPENIALCMHESLHFFSSSSKVLLIDPWLMNLNIMKGIGMILL